MHTFTVRHISKEVAGQVVGDGDVLITGVAHLDDAGAGQITFIGDAHYARRWPESKASAALVAAKLAQGVTPGEGRAIIVVPNADLAMAIVLELFAPPAPVAGLPARDLELSTAHKGHVAIHPTAIVDATAQIGKAVRIGANCVVGPRAAVGDRTVLYSGVTLMDDSRVGHDGVLWPGVVIRERCTVGDRCILHPNVVVGADGFGYRPAPGAPGAPGGKSLVKVPQIGHVEIGHDVELGAATTIDRGKFSATVIGDGCKIDNLCQIAHNCRLGRSVVMAAQVGLAGSVTVGDGVMFGGKAGVGDHVTVGAGAQIGAFCGVFQDVEPGARLLGQPATDTRQFFRQVAAVQRLPELLKELRRERRGETEGENPRRDKA